MNPDSNESYKILGIEQADGININDVYNRVKEEISRMDIITRAELNYENLVKSINTKVIPIKLIQ